jgi:hypothetical protein
MVLESYRYDRCVVSYSDPAALTGDPRVLRVAIGRGGESLAGPRTVTALDVDQTRAQAQQLPDNPFHEPAALTRQACHERARSAAAHGAGPGNRD